MAKGTADERDILAEILDAAMTGKVKSSVVYAVAQDIDWVNHEMTALGVVDELPYYEVSLGLGSFKKKPKKGSICTLGILEGQEAFAYLIDAQEIEEVVYTHGETSFTINEQGYQIKQGSENLLNVMSDFIDEVSKVVVSIGVTPNVGALTKIKKRLNNVLK